ncbi:MAG: hypothetical protein H6674_10575 [Dehalococcoidia bacterium]|nr:hypothetical protein [Dehalococcoidia bacterium]
MVAGDVVTLTVTATDDDMVLVEGLTVDGVNVPLDPSGVGTWTATTPGRFDAEASAIDPTGNRGFGEAQLRVLDPSDTEAPFVELTAPVANDILTYLHDAVGTVRDPEPLSLVARDAPRRSGWLPHHAHRHPRRGVGAARPARRHPAPQRDLDPPSARRGPERVTSSVEVPVRVQGGAKLGVVHLEFTDLVVPDFGIPIAANRIYDSRDADQIGDFGYGWTLDIRQGSIQHNYVVGEGIAVYTTAGDMQPCQRFDDQLGHYAEVRLSDDEWYTFRPVVLEPGPLAGGCSGTVAYELVDGVRPAPSCASSATATCARARSRWRASARSRPRAT